MGKLLKLIETLTDKIDSKVKLLGFLIFLAIFGYVLIWPIMYVTNGDIWEYGNRIYAQYKLFNPSIDGGFFEQFQYILLSWCAALSFLIFLKQNRFVYPIPLIYLFLFFDDFLGLHDTAFKNVLIPFYSKTILANTSIVRVKDFAEISYWILIFFIVLIIIFPAIKYGTLRSRNFILNNFKFFIALAFFASLIDIVGSNIDRWISIEKTTFSFVIVRGVFIILEEVGEISVIAIAFLWLYSVASNKSLLKKSP